MSSAVRRCRDATRAALLPCPPPAHDVSTAMATAKPPNFHDQRSKPAAGSISLPHPDPRCNACLKRDTLRRWRHIVASFGLSHAEKDADRIVALFATEVTFRGVTPMRFWEADSTRRIVLGLLASRGLRARLSPVVAWRVPVRQRRCLLRMTRRAPCRDDPQLSSRHEPPG
jgi:hypothetical protein